MLGCEEDADIECPASNDDPAEALLNVAYNTSSVTVHGITRDDTLDGLDEPEA